MTTQAPTTQASPSSQDLAATRELLGELQAVTREAETDSQTKAVTATAHAILVLAEQVAAIRVLLVSEAMARRAQDQSDAAASDADAQTEPQADKARKKRGWW